MTGNPVCFATRSAVRWRVPDSSDGIVGSGIRCTAARTMRVPSLDITTAPSILHNSRSRVDGELDVKRESAGADRLDDLVVTEHDQRAGAAAENAFQAIAQRRAGRHQRQNRAQRVAAPPQSHLPVRSTPGQSTDATLAVSVAVAFISAQSEHNIPLQPIRANPTGSSYCAVQQRDRLVAQRWPAIVAQAGAPRSAMHSADLAIDRECLERAHDGRWPAAGRIPAGPVPSESESSRLGEAA